MRQELVLKCMPLLLACILLFSLPNALAVCKAYHYNSDDCGTTEEIPGDIRTQIPWVTGIFHQPDQDSNYTFLAAGTIIGPTTILTVFSGAQDKLPKKIRGKQLGQTKDSIIIAVGLKSGKLESFDKFTQLSEITFIEPYLGTEELNREYHFVLLHLKTPLDFSTPYVRPICLSYFKLGRKMNETSLSFLHGGFAKKKVKDKNETDWEVELKIQVVLTGTGYDCVKAFEKYYDKHFPGGMFCSRVPDTRSMAAISSQRDSSFFSCLIQGSSVVQKIGQQWYMAGVTSLIRGRKAGICKNDAIYFNSRLSTALEWIERSLRCSPFSFSCSDGTCIPLESVCNSVRNCLDNGLDENEILCETNSKCDTLRYKSHQCNLVGRCIKKDQVCDGLRDCEEGTDESLTLCNKDLLGSRSSRDLSPNVIQYCLPLTNSEGVQIEYISVNHNGMANCSFIPVNTFALSKCKAFYKSRHLYSHLEQQCNDNGKWSGQTKFECEPDCGNANNKISLGEIHKPVVSLPWHALIFDLNKKSHSIEFLCGGTLITRDFLVTAGHCFEARGSLKSYKIVLSPVSKNFSLNLEYDHSEILEIDSVYRPEEYNATTRNADIALVKVKRNVQFGGNIRPACFLREDDENENSNDIGSIPSLTSAWNRKNSFSIGGLHISNFPEVADMACILKDFVQIHGDFKCVGHKFGVPVHLTDTGGGLVSLTKTKFGARYVVKGVMSKEESFSLENITRFTSLERYRNWIVNIINR